MPTPPREIHTDDQDIFDLSIDKMVVSLLQPIDAIRSQTAGDGFLESRLNAFYRMIGFPVVKGPLEFFSPGYDVNVNTDGTALLERQAIINSVAKNKQLISQQLNPRELVFKNYSRIFAAGGFNAKAVALGSLFIRSFENQFGSTEPLQFDSKQTQSVDERTKHLEQFYSVSPEQTELFGILKSKNFLTSTHPLKPFIVDPRIVVYPDTNLVAAPFLFDSSQLQCFSGTSYKRPYIERVITIRLNNQNSVKSNVNISKIIEDIKNDSNVTDIVLLNITNNPEKELQNSDITVFNNYLKLLRALINILVKSIKEVQDVKLSINFQPLPDAVLGLEGDVTIEGVERDKNNKEIEINILELYSKTSFTNFAFASDFGVGENPDPGGFVFSNLDDMVFSADKAIENSTQEQLDILTARRKSQAEPGIQALKNIEYIMGEFSGLGLIDIVAIQSALWLMDRDKLVGLIDSRAYERLKNKKYRPNLNVSGISRSEDVLESIKDFETKLKDIYSLIQLYFDQIYNGKAFQSS